jgi:predicted MFS family arabinose efflux permease
MANLLTYGVHDYLHTLRMYIGFYSYAAYVFSLSRDGGATPPHLFEWIWTMNSSSSTRPEPAARRPWLAVSAVGLATFSVVTTEMLPVGLLTSIAGSLGTSMGRAGLMISLPALLAALFAPLVVMAAGGMDRRRILCGLLALLVLANLASALAPSLIWLLAARVLVGFCMGGIWAIAGGLAARLVPQASMGLATSIIFGGVAAASVLGVPLGALIGDFAGWRWAFGGMAGFSALVLALHMAVLPALPATGSASLRQFSHQLANRRLQAGLALTLLLVAGHFMSFTFVRPLLLTVSGFDAQWMSALLLAYGIAGIAGNFLAGIIAARRTVPSLAAIAMGLLLAPVLFLSVGDSPTGGGAVLLVWGLAYGGVSVGLMTWMMQAAPRAVEIATALYVGVFNIGIALGSWAGGQLVDGWGLHATLWLSGGLAAAALLLSAAMGLVGRNGPVAA